MIILPLCRDMYIICWYIISRNLKLFCHFRIRVFFPLHKCYIYMHTLVIFMSLHIFLSLPYSFDIATNVVVHMLDMWHKQFLFHYSHQIFFSLNHFYVLYINTCKTSINLFFSSHCMSYWLRSSFVLNHVHVYYTGSQ